MSDYAPGDVRAGLRCMAPIKRNGRAELEDVLVTWVSLDGFVAEVQTTTPKRKVLLTARSVALLRKPGTVPPAMGIVV